MTPELDSYFVEVCKRLEIKFSENLEENETPDW